MQKKIKELEKLAGVTPLKSNTEAKKQQDEDKKRLQPILLVNTDGIVQPLKIMMILNQA